MIVPGPHCPSCGGKLWKTDETGATTEFQECSACGFKIGDEPPPIEPMRTVPAAEVWLPSRLERFVLAMIEARVLELYGSGGDPEIISGNDASMREVVRCARTLLAEIDKV